MSFSENIKRLQQENHETNYRLAKSLNVHASTVQHWRDGKKPLLDNAVQVAHHYGKTLEEIMN